MSAVFCFEHVCFKSAFLKRDPRPNGRGAAGSFQAVREIAGENYSFKLIGKIRQN